jgi:biotin carboxyl carrier protein
MKISNGELTSRLIKKNNSWINDKNNDYQLVVKDHETVLITTPDKVFTFRCLSVNTEEKTVTLLYNANKYTLKITEPLDELLKSMGLENALTPKISEVKAPMPGLVLDILVKPGDSVKKGDKILILEAMKMENAIKSPIDAVISEIHVSQGNAVDKNQSLVVFQ